MDATNTEPRRDGAVLFPWMAVAWENFGAHEREGLEADPQIKAWADAFGIENFNEDTDPYCALFPRWCFYTALPNEPLPNHPSWSLGWLRFGRPCDATLAAIAVFFRDDPVKQIGHVAFVLADKGTDLEVLGANQSNAVSVKLMPKARLLGCRWPLTF